MPIPLILGAFVAAGSAGLLSGFQGILKIKEANSILNDAKFRHMRNQERFKKQNGKTSVDMDRLGSLELNILDSFKTFSDVFEKIKSRPKFKEYQIDGFNLRYNGEELKNVSVGAGALLGGLEGAVAGTAGGFAAAGATTAAVTALETAPTGAVASLTSATAINATMSALFSATTLGVGFLVCGFIINHTGSSLSEKADEAWNQMKRSERKINRACDFMQELSQTASEYTESLNIVNLIYQDHLKRLKDILYVQQKAEWNSFTTNEKRCTENTVLLVGLLYQMCKVKLVIKTESKTELNQINTVEVKESMSKAELILESHDFDLKK